jgi:hypothetical protein
MPEKKEMEILFPEVEVEGIKISPWSWGKLAIIAPYFFPVAQWMANNKITVSNATEHWAEIILKILPSGPEIISKTIDIPIEEVVSWPPEKGMAVLTTILLQNVKRIKNYFGPVSELLDTMKKMDEKKPN